VRDATSPRPATIALIGCGRVVERYHLPALLRRRDAVAAVVEPGGRGGPGRLRRSRAFRSSPRSGSCWRGTPRTRS
jgi:hypothetical protein